jgi:catechol 2,3-dioxygenase-like lactoylglutathione lyase family enzyme
MKHDRSKLPGDFAAGKTDRRRFIQALGAGATAALGACTFPRLADPDAGGGFTRATAVNHISYAVADYARSRDFYMDLLGMKLAWDDGKKCSVEFGDPAKPDAIYIVPGKPGAKANLSHIGYSIENYVGHKSALETEFKRRNIEYKGDTEWGWTLNDAAGYMIHFIAETGIFPGASEPCAVMASEKCKAADAIGLKNLAKASKPGGNGFKAIAFNHIDLRVPDIAQSRAFYRELFGMQEVYYKADEPNAQCFLRFGNDALYLRKSQQPGGKPYVDHVAFTVVNYNHEAVGAELKRRGLNPQVDGKLAWAVRDPDGTKIELTGKELPERG